MEKGKFSQPRPYRDEERQIEEAFRQITEYNSSPRRPIKTIKDAAADVRREPVQDTVQIPRELLEGVADLSPQPTEEPIEESIFREIEKTYPDPEPPKIRPVPQPAVRRSREDLLPFPEIPDEDFAPEEESVPPESFSESAFAFFQKYSKWILSGVFIFALVLLFGVISIFASGGSTNKADDRILNNVMVAGVNVGGMTQQEAIQAVRQATANTYTRQDMVVNISGTQILLSPKDTGAQLDVKAAVEAAYHYGRTGTQEQQAQAQADSLKGNHTIGLLPYLKLDKDFIRLVLESTAGDSGSTLTQATYGLEGSYPSLSVLNFDPASAQTLVLTMGTPGVSFDVDDAYDQILDAYSLHVFEVNITDVQPAIEPDPVDLEAIYQELYVEPVNDTLNMQTFETIPGSYGYEFDLEAAQKIVDTAQYGQIIRIPMVFIAPELLEDTVLFQDIMGEYQTKVSGNNDLINNIQLACNAINGTVLQPGELFSFNTIVGEPTEKKGFVYAPVFLGGEQIWIPGGGISQSATTLYCAALLADMEIVSRVNHDMPVSYVDMGLDAYVSWNQADLKFRNNSTYPVQIKAAVSGSYVTIQILGTDKRDYFVKLDHSVTNVYEPENQYEDYPHDNENGYKDGDVIEEGYAGYTAKTYKVKYSRSTGRKISSDYEATSRYAGRDHLIARVAPPETTVPETTVPETTVPETTVPETESIQTEATESVNDSDAQQSPSDDSGDTQYNSDTVDPETDELDAA